MADVDVAVAVDKLPETCRNAPERRCNAARDEPHGRADHQCHQDAADEYFADDGVARHPGRFKRAFHFEDAAHIANHPIDFGGIRMTIVTRYAGVVGHSVGDGDAYVMRAIFGNDLAREDFVGVFVEARPGLGLKFVKLPILPIREGIGAEQVHLDVVLRQERA